MRHWLSGKLRVGTGSALVWGVGKGASAVPLFVSARELQKQMSGIRFSALGPPFLSPFRLSTEAAFRLINCNKLSLEFCVLEICTSKGESLMFVAKASNKFLLV